MIDTKVSGAAATTPLATKAIQDDVVSALQKLELSSAPADVMLDQYRGILAKAADLPPAVQWEVTYHAISVLTAIEAAQDAPRPIRALGRFLRRLTRVMGDGGIGGLLRRTIRGGPGVDADAEVALAKLARAPNEGRIKALLETSPGLLPPGVDQVRMPLEDGALVLTRATGGRNTVTLTDAAGAALGDEALLGRLKEEAAPMAQDFARHLRKAIATASRPAPASE